VIWRRRVHRHRIFTPSFSADGRLMATASDDWNDRDKGVVRLWSLPASQPVGRPLR
jgi:hypothetical protein